MNKFIKGVITCTLSVIAVYSLVNVKGYSAATDSATFNIEVQAVLELAISGSPGALIISTATAGSAPADAVDSSTTYAFTSNSGTRRIHGSVDVASPSGVSLFVFLTSPTGPGTSAGMVLLSLADADLVTGITASNEALLGITYTLSATTAAGVVPSTSRVVTYTILT